jgi:predicted nucleotidyltransferase component of viral defense system
MATTEPYRRRVGLLLRILPLVAAEPCLALKGGTAINLFVRDMPRLSVDIDLTYLPVGDRGPSLAAIDAALNRIADTVIKSIGDVRVQRVALAGEACICKLLIGVAGAQLKVEVNPVIRGCVFAPRRVAVSPAVESAFGFAEALVVSDADLYGGKIVAALDRQHPRDLFDVHDLLQRGAIDDELRAAFIVYLMSSDRPMAEILNPRRNDITAEFRRGLLGMTAVPTTLEALIDARERLISDIVGNMPRRHRAMLLTFEQGEPDWSALGLANVDAFPAVRWRLENFRRRSAAKRDAEVLRLASVLGVRP